MIAATASERGPWVFFAPVHVHAKPGLSFRQGAFILTRNLYCLTFCPWDSAQSQSQVLLRS